MHATSRSIAYHEAGHAAAYLSHRVRVDEIGVHNGEGWCRHENTVIAPGTRIIAILAAQEAVSLLVSPDDPAAKLSPDDLLSLAKLADQIGNSSRIRKQHVETARQLVYANREAIKALALPLIAGGRMGVRAIHSLCCRQPALAKFLPLYVNCVRPPIEPAVKPKPAVPHFDRERETAKLLSWIQRELAWA